VVSAVVPGAVVNSDLLPRDLPFLPSERGDESLKPPPAAHGAGFLIEAEWPNLLSVICFAISSVAENEEHYGRQRPRAERYPKQNLRDLPRSRAISVARGTDAKKTMKMKIDHASI
jgi:hypothetical protein